MPVVPIRPETQSELPKQLQPPPLDPKYLLMAAAQMHSEGRLIKKGSKPSGTQQDQS